MPSFSESSLFNRGRFSLHSGGESDFLIDCSALTATDLQALASRAAQMLPPFGRVEGIPTGGLQFADYLKQHIDPNADQLLIADDVLTTGASMEEYRAGRSAIGVVIFARGIPPVWVVPLLVLTHNRENNG